MIVRRAHCHSCAEGMKVMKRCLFVCLFDNKYRFHTHLLPDMKEFRLGAQKAYCTYARLKISPLSASESMFGVCASEKLNAPMDGRMSSYML